MNALLDLPVVALSEASLPLTAFLHRLHQRGRLQPLLQEAVVEQFLLDCATEENLAATARELQRAADAFRHRHGLQTEDQTRAWLEGQRLSVLDFEATLERDLLLDKLRDRVTRDGIAGQFEAHRDDYALVLLRTIVVPREDIARELLSQIREEGRDFEEVARNYLASSPSGATIERGWLFRKQLPQAVAEAVFAAGKGQMAGPLATAAGFQLLLVDDIRPAELDEQTIGDIRSELFEAWLNERLQGSNMRFPLLDLLRTETRAPLSVASPHIPSLPGQE